MRGWSSMTSAKPKSRRGRSGSCADRLAGSGSGGDVGSDGVGSSVGWLLLSALVGQPGGGQELAEPGLGPAVGESTKDVAEVLEGRRANQIAVDDESMQNREPAGTVVGAGKQEIPAPDGGTALLALDMGVGQRDPRIVEEDDEGRPLVDGVRDGLAQRTLGRGAARQVADDPVEALDERAAVALAAAQELFEVDAIGASLGLHRVDTAQHRHHDRGSGITGVERGYEAAAAVVHATRAAGAVGTRKDRPESGVAVGLDHLAAEVRQDRLWPRALPVRGVLAERDFAAIAQEGPDMAALDAAYVAAVAHRQVGIVEAEQVTTEGVVAERSMKRLDEGRGPRVPVAERRRRDPRATAGQNLALALQRHGVGVLRRHELREHARTRAGTLDRRWRGRRGRHVAFADLAGADLGMLLHRVGFARAVLDRDPHVGPDERLLGAAAAQLFVGRRDLGDH